MNIFEFKPLAEIVRIEPACKIKGCDYDDNIENLLLGERVTLVNLGDEITLEKDDEHSGSWDGKTTLILPCKEFNEGWMLWSDYIEKLTLNSKMSDDSFKIEIKRTINKAIDSEDYEFLHELKEILNSTVKNKNK